LKDYEEFIMGNEKNMLNLIEKLYLQSYHCRDI
jgi:hypothetical protein